MKYSDFFTEKGIPRKVYALGAPEIGGILIEIGFSGPIVCPKRKICLLAHRIFGVGTPAFKRERKRRLLFFPLIFNVSA